MRALAEGEPALGLPALGGIFATDRCPHLDTADVANHRFHDAVYKLAWIRTCTGPMPVRWRDMGTEELGARDSFFLPANVPYTYKPGPDGVELLEIRHAASFNFVNLAKGEGFWDKAVEMTASHREAWQTVKRPSVSA